jgi:hypothetical protein
MNIQKVSAALTVLAPTVSLALPQMAVNAGGLVVCLLTLLSLGLVRGSVTS